MATTETGARPATVRPAFAGGRRSRLRLRLVAGDSIALAATVAVGEAATGWRSSGGVLTQSVTRMVLLTVAGLFVNRSMELYRAARAAIRTVELTAIVRAAAVLGVLSSLYDQVVLDSSNWGRAATVSITAIFLLTAARSVYRAWLRAERARGRHARPVVIVGANDDAARLARVMADHPEAGFAPAGVCGDLEQATASGLRAAWRGDIDHAIDLVRRREVTGAVVVASALDIDELNRVVRDVTALGGHVHLSSGLRGIDHRRINSQPIAHEPLLHVEPKELSQYQAAVKRCIDVAISSIGLVTALPVLALAAIAIKINDRGPVLFRQTRVGRDGSHFQVLKLRTMVVGAEARLDELTAGNLRAGPLFKLERDPRVTRFGRFLRATSIDELPQFVNVLRGEMSLVGPRPALPSEMEQFPEALRDRVRVLPGVTGLWQVEARDSPSFAAYERLDLFYVENWSPTLDLVIMLATLESELARVVGRVLDRVARKVVDVTALENSDAGLPVRPTLTD